MELSLPIKRGVRLFPESSWSYNMLRLFSYQLHSHSQPKIFSFSFSCFLNVIESLTVFSTLEIGIIQPMNALLFTSNEFVSASYLNAQIAKLIYRNHSHLGYQHSTSQLAHNQTFYPSSIAIMVNVPDLRGYFDSISR